MGLLHMHVLARLESAQQGFAFPSQLGKCLFDGASSTKDALFLNSGVGVAVNTPPPCSIIKEPLLENVFQFCNEDVEVCTMKFPRYLVI